jgi:hypothetical protein
MSLVALLADYDPIIINSARQPKAPARCKGRLLASLGYCQQIQKGQ